MFSSPYDSFAAEFEATELDVHRDRVVHLSVMAQKEELITYLDSVRVYTSINQRTAGLVRGSFLYSAIFRIMQKFTAVCGDPIGGSSDQDAAIVSMASQVLANCGGDATQDRCPAYVTFESGYTLTVHHPDYVTSQTAARIWDGALVLAAWVLEQPQDFALFCGKSVLEIGSGTGLVGLAVAKRFGHRCERVVLSDADEAVATVLRRSLMENEVSTKNVSAIVLHWSESDLSLYDGAFDVILGSDVVYDSTTLDGVVHVCHRCLRKTPEAKVVLCCGVMRECVDEIVRRMSQEEDRNGEEGGRVPSRLQCLREVRPGRSLTRQTCFPEGANETVFFEFGWVK